jgi:hypothetical protein
MRRLSAYIGRLIGEDYRPLHFSNKWKPLIGLQTQLKGTVIRMNLEKEMSVWNRWMEHPERVWVRKWFFDIHLWVGAGVGLYIVLMSITGSLIVYRNEMERAPSLVSSVEWIVELHENLLCGRNGRFVNGIGANSVILLCLTGAVIWWPGISNWRRALTVNWRSPFARFSWDLHSALGLWSSLFVLMRGISGFYFAFPQTLNSLFGLIDHSDLTCPRKLVQPQVSFSGYKTTRGEADDEDEPFFRRVASGGVERG